MLPIIGEPVTGRARWGWGPAEVVAALLPLRAREERLRGLDLGRRVVVRRLGEEREVVGRSVVIEQLRVPSPVDHRLEEGGWRLSGELSRKDIRPTALTSDV